MNQGVQYDDAWSQRLLRMYLTPDLVQQRKLVLGTLELKPNERVLDIGSGPGLVAEEMAPLVGPRGAICGFDSSEQMVALSQQRCSHLPQVTFRKADAADLPYDDNEFDVAVSTQVYEYIDDIETCLRELYRVIKPSGRAVIVSTDWDTLIWNTEDPERMRHILTTFEAHCADPRQPRKLSPKLRNAGLQTVRHDVYTVLNAEYHENTYSHGLIDFIKSYVLGKNGVTPEEAKAWADEQWQRGQEGAYFFSLNRYLFLVKK